MTVLAIIPARFASSRFPGKPLAPLSGRPMIQWVYERACAARRVDEVVVATDDARIAEAVGRFGGRVVLTSAEHRSGTDRVAEVVRGLGHGRDVEVVVNVQGDEPLIDPASIDLAIAPLLENATLEMATLATPLTDPLDVADPNKVKVVTDRAGFALYFSRAPIPFRRNGHGAPGAPGSRVPARPPGQPEAAPACSGSGERRAVASAGCSGAGGAPLALKHVGLYVYRPATLLRLAALPPTPLELAESLEQLRALEHGVRIKVVAVERDSPGVDTPEDLARAEALVARTEGAP